MIKKWQRFLWLAGIAGGLGLSAAATAQTGTPFQPFKNLFGSKTASPEKTKAQDPNRLMEILVELAWLSDPMTFPYYLEAHVKGSALEVRGYVPSKAVREQAVSLAKLYCPLVVTDATNDHSSLTIRPTPRSPGQLQTAVQTALREAFPAQRFTVSCEAGGVVQISGSVRSLEQKLAVSKSLRRLHGCTGVINLTEAEGAEIVQQPRQSDKAPVVATVEIQPVSSSSSITPVKSNEIEWKSSQSAPMPLPTGPKTAALGSVSAAQLKRRIEMAIPTVRNVVVTFTSKTDVRLECSSRPGDDTGALAGQILSLRELDPYKVDLQIQVPMPEKK
jgi:osmotically-inducible protein OsmY